MKLALAVLTSCLWYGLINCSSKNVTVIEVKPCTSALEGIQLSPKSENIIVESFSFCLRFRIKSWTLNLFSLVQFGNFLLYLTPFEQYLGYFQQTNDNLEVSFGLAPKKGLSFSTKSWNSICVVYNSQNHLLIAYFNGDTLNTTLLSGFGLIGNFSLSQIKLTSWNDYSAYFTYFNAWSRALTQDEAKKISSGSDLIFNVNAKNGPNIFDWRDLSGVELDGNCSAWRNFDAKKVKMNNAISETIVTNHFNYDEAVRACERQNGVLIDPNESSYFDRLENTTLLKVLETCRHKFWVPIRKFAVEGNTKDKFAKTLPSKQGGKENIMNQNYCSSFWSSSGNYESAQCDSKLCSLCQLDLERLVFKIQLDCQEHQKIVSGSYVIEQPKVGELVFTGWISNTNRGASTIKKIGKKWILSMMSMTEKPVGESWSDDIYGLSKWTSTFCGDNQTTRVKLTNVSHFSIIAIDFTIITNNIPLNEFPFRCNQNLIFP